MKFPTQIMFMFVVDLYFSIQDIYWCPLERLIIFIWKISQFHPNHVTYATYVVANQTKVRVLIIIMEFICRVLYSCQLRPCYISHGNHFSTLSGEPFHNIIQSNILAKQGQEFVSQGLRILPCKFLNLQICLERTCDIVR